MTDPIDLYLELLKRALVNTLYRDPRIDPGVAQIYDPVLRLEGRDWPRDAHTMIGRKRLDQLDACCRLVLSERVAGDFLEAGVWRGGASIFMRGVLEALGDATRRVWVADSFRGLPPPDAAAFPVDSGSQFHEFDALAVSLEAVRDHFDRYGLLDERVAFLKGWFKDTLPSAPVERLAVLRLDGDMYESTWQTLEALYPKLSPGGFVIVDDYGCIPASRQAVEEFRLRHAITEPIVPIDWTGVYWRRSS